MDIRKRTIGEARQWGATFGFYAPRGYYSSPEAQAEIDALAATGANWVIVVATVWQDTATSVSQYRDCALTPDDLELAKIVEYARAKGLKVQLRPMLECKDGLGSRDVWQPRERERMAGRRSSVRRAWFESMAARTACYASLARYMDALFSVFAREDWCLGFHWWKWDQHSPVKSGATPAQTHERDFTIRGKRAEGVFSRWARDARHLATAVVAAALGTVAFGASADSASPVPSRPSIEAAATLGGGVSIADPAGMQFSPGVYSRAWKLHRATGGARIGDDPAARAFAIELSEHVGENVAAGAVRFDGRCLLSPGVEDENALDVAWSIVPDGDAAIAEAAMESRFGLARFPGGFLMDGALVQIPQDPPSDIHLFRGAVSRIDALDADGNPAFSVSFRERTGVLLQDNRGLGGSSATLRFFFAQGNVKKGKTYTVRASFRVPGHAIRLRAGDRTVVEAGPNWIPVVPPAHGEDWVAPGSGLDLGATLPPSAPAGRFGRVVAVRDHFEFENRPGIPQRFCGVNLCADANTPSTPEDAERFAANLARFGFNAVRIHHHDKAWATAHASRKVEKSMSPPQDGDDIDRLDFLVAACIRHGIYLTTDLYVSRPPASWRAIGVERDGAPSREEFKRLVVFHEGAYSNLCDWARAFLCHVNPYTGRSLAEEPALCSLALVNEGNVGNWGRDALLATPGVREAWQAWLVDKGKPMPPDSALSATLYAAAEDAADPTHDFALFLAESEAKFFDRMAGFVREELGCRAPLSNLSSWYNPAAYALVRSGFNYCDAHGYVDHPSFIGKQRFSLPATHPGVNPLLGGEAVPRLSWLRRFGKPFSVTEWNWAAPGKFRAASGLVMGALAARQDWSAIWRFAWSHSRAGVEAPGSVPIRFFDLHNDPATAASARAEICLFLRGDLASLPADSGSPAEYDETTLRGGAGSATRIVPPPNAQSGWEKRIGVRLGPPPSRDSEAQPTAFATEGDFAAPVLERGAFVVASPRTCGGFAERGRIDAGALSFNLAVSGEAQNTPAALWVSSLDGKPIAESSRMLLSHVTEAMNSGAAFDDPNRLVWTDYGKLPVLMRNGAAAVELKMITNPQCSQILNDTDTNLCASVSPCETINLFTVFALDTAGNRVAKVPADFANGILRFTVRTDLNPSSATFLYEIVRGDTATPYTIASGPDWVPIDYRKDVITDSALDFSRFSNDAPAGKHGWLRRVGGHFEFEGRPGENVRFYGANICFDACFPTHEEAELLVRRLKATGYNSIRLHHHDNGLVPRGSGPSDFDADSLDRFDYLVATAINAGLYVTTDLYVSRRVKWRDIEIDRDDEVPVAVFKALITFHEPAFRNWKSFATAFMEHVNPYTGRRYADEPGMPLVCLVNEGNYRVNWAETAQLPCVREAWGRWAAAKLAEDPQFAGGDDISDPSRLEWNKVGRFTHTALATFLAEMEEKSYARELAAMREIGAKALFTSLNHLPFHAPDHAVRQRLYDYFDDHCYVDHPFWPEQKWRLPAGGGNLNPLLDQEFRLPKHAFHRLWGLPTTMSEWNFAGPNAWRGMGGLLTGAMAAGQEWSGVWRFAYAHHRDALKDGAGGFFDIAKDPLNMLAERTVVPLFLRGDFDPLPRKIALTIDEKAQRPRASQMPAFFPEWRADAVWRSQVGVAFPGTTVPGADVFDLSSVMDDTLPPLALGNPPQMRIDREAGTFVVETPLTCGGFATNGTISAGALSATVVRGGPTTVAATSLDGKPLGESRHVLVTHLTDAQAEGRQFGDETRTRMLAWGHQPVLIRDGEAEISLEAPLANIPAKWRVWTLGTDGKREGIVESRCESGRIIFMARVRRFNGACMAYEIDGDDTDFPMAAGAASASTTTN